MRNHKYQITNYKKYPISKLQDQILKNFIFCFCNLFVICGLLFGILLAGCGSPTEVPQRPTARKIVVWHWMTDREEAFQELSKQYEAKTGVKVVFELYAPPDAYSQKVRAAAQAAALPDIFGLLGEKRDFGAFIKAGHIANLTLQMEADNAAWKNTFFDKALSVNEFQEGNEFGVAPGIYGAPIDVMNIQMVYNKNLFKKAGLDPNKPPMTWEEFVDACQKLNAAGIQGLVSGWGEIWLID
jgi:ABC-type glycerol-3-phosphate transport system substrate-binding protein